MTNILNINGRDYELLTFRRKLTNKSEEVYAISLAKGYLAIGDKYRIYNTVSGLPIMRGRFLELDSALKLANWIEKELWDYLDIWSTYPTANLISWCKYSTEFGARLFETVEILNNLDTITDQDLKDAHNRAKELEEKWKV